MAWSLTVQPWERGAGRREYARGSAKRRRTCRPARAVAGPDYPSAVKALAAARRPFAAAGAGVIGSANPEGSNWKRFWAEAAPPGSWLLVLPR